MPRLALHRPDPRPGLPRLLTAAEVADLLRIGERTLRRLRQTDRRFPTPRRVGRQALRWYAADIAAYLDRETKS